jgi:hypothetical protein
MVPDHKGRAIESLFPEKTHRRQSDFAIDAGRSRRTFRGFLPRKTTPRDPYEITVIAKPLSAAIMMPEFEEQTGPKFERTVEPTGQYLQPLACQLR